MGLYFPRSQMEHRDSNLVCSRVSLNIAELKYFNMYIFLIFSIKKIEFKFSNAVQNILNSHLMSSCLQSKSLQHSSSPHVKLYCCKCDNSTIVFNFRVPMNSINRGFCILQSRTVRQHVIKKEILKNLNRKFNNQFFIKYIKIEKKISLSEITNCHKR